MIGAIFQLLNELVEVRIDRNNCLFRTGEYGGAFVPIDSIKLDKNGVIKEHPDLKDKDDWREQAVIRFKEHLKTLDGETKKINYVIDELKKLGYKPLYLQRQGHRTIKLQ